jgi:hypothetical protein
MFYSSSDNKVSRNNSAPYHLRFFHCIVKSLMLKQKWLHYDYCDLRYFRLSLERTCMSQLLEFKHYCGIVNYHLKQLQAVYGWLANCFTPVAAKNCLYINIRLLRHSDYGAASLPPRFVFHGQSTSPKWNLIWRQSSFDFAAPLRHKE